MMEPAEHRPNRLALCPEKMLNAENNYKMFQKRRKNYTNGTLPWHIKKEMI